MHKHHFSTAGALVFITPLHHPTFCSNLPKPIPILFWPSPTIYRHMCSFSSHIICILRNRLFHVGLPPKSSGKEYKVDKDKRHPNFRTKRRKKQWADYAHSVSMVQRGCCDHTDLIFVIFSPHRFYPHRFFSTQIFSTQIFLHTNLEQKRHKFR